MVKKQIKPSRKQKHAINKPETVDWRKFAPYIFMGIELLLGITALLLVVNQVLVLAGRIILISMVIAGLEYQWRRVVQGPSSFEDEFSTLSDILNFSVVPGLMIYQLAFRGWGVLGLAGVFVIVFSGMVRLSLYRIYNPVTEKRAFIGLPLTINAAFISLIAQLITRENIAPNYRLLLLGTITILAFLTVSPLRYPNPAEKSGLLILLLIAMGALFWSAPINIIASWGLLISGLGYIIFAPIWLKKRNQDHG